MMPLNTQCCQKSGLIMRKEDRSTDIPDEKISRMIIQKLLETQGNYNVKIPLAVESGGRVWEYRGMFGAAAQSAKLPEKPDVKKIEDFQIEIFETYL